MARNKQDNAAVPELQERVVYINRVSKVVKGGRRFALTALVVGSTFGGAVGMIVALPLVAVIKSLFIFYFETRTGEQIVSYEGALFRGAPFRDAQGNPVPAFDALGDDGFVADSQILDEGAVPEAEAMPKPELENPWAKLIDFENPFAAREHVAASKKPEETDTSDDGR